MLRERWRGSVSANDPPPAVPDDVAARLADLDAAALRATLAYGRRLLADRETNPADEIDARSGERLVSVERHDGYAVVVKAQPCAEGCEHCPHGPYVYHVTRRPGEGDTTLDWTFIGRYEGDEN